MDTNNDNSCTEQAKIKPRLVERRTGLRGQHIGAASRPTSVLRKQTRASLNERDPEIPYVKFESGLRDLVCSLMERQDRMNEELLRRMIDLQYRMDDIEADLPAMKEIMASGTGGPRP